MDGKNAFPTQARSSWCALLPIISLLSSLKNRAEQDAWRSRPGRAHASGWRCALPIALDGCHRPMQFCTVLAVARVTKVASHRLLISEQLAPIEAPRRRDCQTPRAEMAERFGPFEQQPKRLETIPSRQRTPPFTPRTATSLRSHIVWSSSEVARRRRSREAPFFRGISSWGHCQDFRRGGECTPGYNSRNAFSTLAKTRFLQERRHTGRM